MDIAQDLVQDIFLSLWTHADLSAIENLEAYLYQATKFSIIKHFHKSNRYTNVDNRSLALSAIRVDL